MDEGIGNREDGRLFGNFLGWVFGGDYIRWIFLGFFVGLVLVME